MFTWIKKLFGTENSTSPQDHYVGSGRGVVYPLAAKPKPLVLTDPIKYEDEVKVTERPPAPTPTKSTKAQIDAIAKAAAPKKAAAAKTTKHTRAKLEKLSKAAIDELAKAELGVNLDRRKTKEFMIKDFLAEQKK